jgi:glycosyltransferase involved in cell wall biosynthesis
MNRNIKIDISYLSDPMSPKAWSGTPYNIVQVLKEENSLGNIYITGINSGLDYFFLKFISAVYYKSIIGLERGRFMRHHMQETCLKKTRKDTSPVLHFSTLDMPHKKNDSRHHFIFCDSTWNIYCNHTQNINAYSKRIILDAEKYEKRSFQASKHIFAISKHLKKNLIEYYGIDPNRISVVGTGRGIIEPYFGSKNYSNGQILFVAKDRFFDKGGPLVLEAFKIALEKNDRLKLVIVGQDEYLKSIHHKDIEVHGFVEKHILQQLFNSSSLFLLPAQYETWGLVYLEALACKMPIIGINKNSFPELSGNGRFGFGLDCENPALLADIILKAFENPDLLKNIGLAGQEYCLKNFSWDNTTNKIIEGIEQYYTL